MSGTARALLDDLLNDFEAMGYGHRPVVERRIDAIIAAARADAAQQEVARLREALEAIARPYHDGAHRARFFHGNPLEFEDCRGSDCIAARAALTPASPVAEAVEP